MVLVNGKSCNFKHLKPSKSLFQGLAKHWKVQTSEPGRGNVGIAVPVACFQYKAFQTKITMIYVFSLFPDFVQRKSSGCSVELEFLGFAVKTEPGSHKCQSYKPGFGSKFI